MKKSMFMYPWDILDEGIGSTLENIKSMGIDEINLAVAYHSGKFLLPHNPKKKIYYHEGGSVYFRARMEKYPILRPVAGEAYLAFQNSNGFIEREDMLSGIIRDGRRLGIGINAWVVGFHNTRLGKLHPEYTIRNAFNENYSHGLCPAHEANQQYVLQMISDLADQYDLNGIILESFDYMGCLHGDHHEIIGTYDRQSLEQMLGLCFCPVCEELAARQGVDVPELKHQIKIGVDRILNQESAGNCWPPDELDGYLKMRAGVVNDIVQKIGQIIKRKNNAMRLYSILWLTDGANPAYYGTVPGDLKLSIDGWIACYPATVDEIRAFIKHVKSLVSEEKLHAGLRMLAPQTINSRQVPLYLQAYHEIGIEHVHLYNYGLMSKSSLEKIKQFNGEM
ncbi:hypothetical protein [Paenibacillus nasutitermitis]|uniref:Glycosyl hydrolase-like 10 domain-containing protein n=1 Tax=Paenibacillus nasutitermitis TaxID=1652958 RepID=A0A917E0N4_9BACL|nr:hypothetical protein [Paenibacillus nasutitermitis]GGD89850.1 hypothetical protein GCM10010911_55630 [Paenibacillus nasutitermitis]